MSVRKKITNYMKEVLRNYDSIRGVHKKTSNFAFWDLVVISASDVEQKIAYEIQIHEKEKRFELPLGISFHVFSDPPGYKIGCGGSTMFVLSELYKLYGCKLLQMRILNIPAGGLSMRLPNLSALGKLFSPLPLGNPPYQMLDLILAVYLPFLENMTSGVFLASSDAIITYHIDKCDQWTFMKDGFTALAHPSSVQIGMQHGVYVLSYDEEHSEAVSCFMSKCSKVLQKPSEKIMYENGAVVTNYCNPGGDTFENTVFSDSAFFFSSSIVQKLTQFYESNKPLQCEISSYGDFLQPLGTDATLDYIGNKAVAAEINSELVNIRRKLYDLLHNSPLHVLVLKHSLFHHLGTMSEYIENLCTESTLAQHFCMAKFSNSVLKNKVTTSLENVKGTLINSIVHSSSHVPETVLLEYCDFCVPLYIGEHCIISNCCLMKSDDDSIRIPSYTLLHTIAVKNGYATIAFSINDDIKKCCGIDEAGNLKFLNQTLKNLTLKDFEYSELFDSNEKCISLWNTKLFPICSTRCESFLKSVALISSVTNNKPLSTCDFKALTSVKEILKLKNVQNMLDYEYDILCKINDHVQDKA